MKVTWFHRDRRQGVFSIEEVFKRISKYLPNDVEIDDYYIPASTWPARLRAVRDVKKHTGDVNHITGDVHFLAMGLPPENTIITIHDIGHYEKNLKGFKKFIYGKLWMDWPLKRVHYISTISHASKQKLVDHFHVDPDKISVIHNPGPEGFAFIPKEKVPDRPKILQIGFMGNKNVERLIEAVEGISCELMLVRKPDDLLKKMMDQHSVRYRFYYDLSYEEVYQKYVECDLLYFASTYEGFGVPIIEAQATGRPVLTSDIAPMPEVAGGGAHFVNPYKTDEIREGILKILEDNNYRKHLIEAGMENIKRFDPQKIAGKYYDLYKQIAR